MSMTPETLKELETLSDEWANEPSGVFDDTDFAKVMDALTELILAVKERDTLFRQRDELIDQRDAAVKERDALSLERAGCERAMSELRRRCGLDETQIELSEVWGHIEGIMKERDAAQKACAEMRDALLGIVGDYLDEIGSSDEGRAAGEFCWRDVKRAKHAISTDCGKGYHHERDCEPLWEAIMALRARVPERPKAITWEDGVAILNYVQDEFLPTVLAHREKGRGK